MKVVARALHRPAGSLASGSWTVLATPAVAGWTHASLRILELAPGGEQSWATGDSEMLIVPLTGACRVEADGVVVELAGRAGVFAGPTDFAYIPRETGVRLATSTGGRFAVPGAVASRRLAVRRGPAESVPVELRGAGPSSRQVNNFCTPAAFEADSLIACEVLTPGGNWSSYPPHKHDEALPGESVLEEIYYYEVADGPAGPGIAYQRVYGAPTRPIDLLAEVRSGDVVFIPHGWHGPSMAAPGYDLYYLNVMAGPGAERAWRITDDPVHAWVRDTWPDQPIDSRLPFAPPRERIP